MESLEPGPQGFKGSFFFVSRRADLGPVTAPMAEFFGGARYGAFWHRSISPLLQLTKFAVYPSGVRISGRFSRISLLVPLWEARFDELTEIWQNRWSIKLVASGHTGRTVTFWGSRACVDRVAAVLRECGLSWTDDEGVATDLRYRPR
ncbi:MAG: hypothetical protein ABSA91_16400 [Acidimicrobiales bacterium]